MTSRLLGRRSEDHAASSRTEAPVPKLIFVCDEIKPNNVNVPEYQRAKMLSDNFRTAIVHRWHIPDDVRGECEAAYRVRGRALAALHGFLLILYLRIVRGYKIVYTGPNVLAIMWGWLAKSFLGCRWVFDLWDHPSLELASAHTFSSLIKKPLYDVFLQSRLAVADTWIIAMHMDVLAYMPKSYPKNRIVHVTNGIDMSSIEYIPDHVAQPHGNRDETVLKVCYAGAIAEWRGMGVLLECLESFGTESEYSINTELFGEHPQTQRDDDIFQALKGLNRLGTQSVRYYGNLPHEEALIKMAESEVCLCILEPSIASYNYSYNVKMFEYLALGKIIVASRTNAFSEIMSDGYNGFLVAFSGEDLRAVFDRIFDMKKKGEIERIAQAARETAEQYRWEDINRRILSHLTTMLKCT